VLKKSVFLSAVLATLCASGSVFAQSPALHQELERPSEPAVQDISDLQLDPTQQHALADALKAHNFQVAEKILVEESEKDPKSLRSAKLLVTAGGIFFLDGKYLNSVICWKRAEAITRLDDRSRFTLAMAYIRLSRRDWARSELETLVTSQPRNPLYLYWLARLDYDAQNYITAIDRLKKVIALDPTMMRAYDSLGLCYDYLGHSDQAIKSYNRAVELNRSQSAPSPWPHVDLAVTLMATNQLPEAEKQLNEALHYDARLPQAHYQLGRLLEMRGAHAAAAEELRLAVAANPSYPEPHLLLGQIYRRLGDQQQAEAEIRQFKELKSTAEPQPSGSSPPSQ
jgi:Flp pilus assembly protein TadD